MASDLGQIQQLKPTFASMDVPPFGVEKVRSALVGYYNFRQASLRPATWADIRDEIYASDATAIDFPDCFFEFEGDQADTCKLDLQDEALRRFAQGFSKKLRNSAHLIAVIDFLVAEKFLRTSDLDGPEPAHHINCSLAKALGRFCFEKPNTHLLFVGNYHCVTQADGAGLVETVLTILASPEESVLETREVSLVFEQRPNERVTLVEGRQCRLECDVAVVRYGTAMLSCKRNLEFAFSELSSENQRRTEASVATMRNVSFKKMKPEDLDAVPRSFELHGDHPLYRSPIVKFERIESAKLILRQQRLEAKVARWHRQP